MAKEDIDTPKGEIQRIFELQKAHQLEVGKSSAKERIDKLKRLGEAMARHREEIREALYKDFRKSPTEADLTETYIVTKEIEVALKNLRRWMKPQAVSTPLVLFGSRSFIQYQPKGVVLIISPWNYPVNLTLAPLVSAIAAGNCVMLKPSEFTPHASALMRRMLEELFEEREVALIEGAVETSQALLELPFNHIYFTGSPAVGKIVMEAAAKHLTSVTLELGGKSPTIIDETADIGKAAARTAWGKFTNKGQTCIAPDYILVHKSRKQEFLEKMKENIEAYYGERPKQSGDYARMVNQKQFERVKGYLEDAQKKGATIVAGGQTDDADNYIAPTLVAEVSRDALLMQEEIFGPILPILGFERLEEAVELVNSKEKPLSLYIFSKNKKNIRYIIENTRAGGTCINHNLMHFGQPNLPFGGDNNSGIGKSHGWYGFEAFSNARGIYKQVLPFSSGDLLRPPYTKWKQRLADLTLKWL